MREIYEAIIRAIRACGPVQIAPTKTGINLGDRITSVRQLSPRSFAHRVRVAAVSEVDAELRDWIREAYAVAKMAGRRPG